MCNYIYIRTAVPWVPSFSKKILRQGADAIQVQTTPAAGCISGTAYFRMGIAGLARAVYVGNRTPSNLNLDRQCNRSYSVPGYH